MSVSSEEEQELLSLENLMRTYGNSVLRLAYSYVHDYATAEDMFQEVFLKADAGLKNFREECQIKTWLLKITVNTCKDYLKSAYHKRVTFFEEGAEETIAASDSLQELEQETDRKRKQKVVQDALQKLPEKYREVLICLYFEEKSVAETAILLSLSEGTVKSRLSRARDRLRELLPEEWRGGAFYE